MSGNKALPFFAAEYEGRRVSIRRTPNYDTMINSIRQTFPSLSDIPPSRVSITQVFPDLGEGAVEITRDMWKDTLPLVKTAYVVVAKAEPQPKSASKKRKAPEPSRAASRSKTAASKTAASDPPAIEDTADSSIIQPVEASLVVKPGLVGRMAGKSVPRTRKSVTLQEEPLVSLATVFGESFQPSPDLPSRPSRRLRLSRPYTGDSMLTDPMA